MKSKKLLEILDSFISDARFMVEIAQEENNSSLAHAWEIRLQQSEIIKHEIEREIQNQVEETIRFFEKEKVAA